MRVLAVTALAQFAFMTDPAIAQNREQITAMQKTYETAVAKIRSCAAQNAVAIASRSSEPASVLAEVTAYRCARDSGLASPSKELREEARLIALDAIVTSRAR